MRMAGQCQGAYTTTPCTGQCRGYPRGTSGSGGTGGTRRVAPGGQGVLGVAALPGLGSACLGCPALSAPGRQPCLLGCPVFGRQIGLPGVAVGGGDLTPLAGCGKAPSPRGVPPAPPSRTRRECGSPFLYGYQVDGMPFETENHRKQP